MAAGRDRGSIQIVTAIDVHFDDSEILFLSFEKQLGFNCQTALSGLERGQGLYREGTVTALRVRQKAVLC